MNKINLHCPLQSLMDNISCVLWSKYIIETGIYKEDEEERKLLVLLFTCD